MSPIPRQVRLRAASIALSVACAAGAASRVTPASAQDQDASRASQSSRRMADGKEWTTDNLNVGIPPAYCYEDSEPNCRRYGRLYTWEAAKRACQSLQTGWRLPTSDEWREMARHYGGVGDDAADNGKAAYKALLIGGSAGFNAVLGGNRDDKGGYARGEAHGFYWTASDTSPATAVLYNFAKGSQALFRQNEGGKQWAFSVRCIRD